MIDANHPNVSAGQESRKLIGVAPTRAVDDHRLLFSALEEAFPVSFEAREQAGEVEALHGLIVLDPPSATLAAGSEGQKNHRCPMLVAFAQLEGATGPSHAIAFSEDANVARPLRGRTLNERSDPARAAVAPAEDDLVLAIAEGEPVWWHRPGEIWTQVSTYWVQELAESESLRDRLTVGHFMGLVPLLHFLWRVCDELGWDERPLSASFVVDDPNLHWTSYGYLNYAELVGHAREHGYHVAFAMVPLDGWFANGRAVSLVRENPTTMSLVMHGNDHVSDELGRLTAGRDAEIVLAQALRRTAAFERRSGVAVERVMVPPHEACSMTALRAMSRLGFDAACIGRRHPWREHEPLPAHARWPLIKWHPADSIAGGLPIIPRYLIDRPREDLVMRALLRQPLILFGHHWDFADGLGALSDAADYINSLGEVHWGSLGSIARRSYLARRDGEALVVEMHSRRVVVDIPEEVSVLVVRTPSAWDEEAERHLAYGADDVPMTRCRSGWASDVIAVAPGERMELALVSEHTREGASIDTRHAALWPVLRRTLVEGRDRTQPLARKLARGRMR
jgi:hypothetical protein